MAVHRYSRIGSANLVNTISDSTHCTPLPDTTWPTPTSYITEQKAVGLLFKKESDLGRKRRSEKLTCNDGSRNCSDLIDHKVELQTARQW